MSLPNVLFVCVENSCRSQMAEGFARVLGQGIINVYSAGSNPSGVVNPEAVAVMTEQGIDMIDARSKSFSDLAVKEFDVVVTMGCGDVCPFVPAKHYRDWRIEDPKGKGRDFFCYTRDSIKNNVLRLIQELKTEGKETSHGTSSA